MEGISFSVAWPHADNMRLRLNTHAKRKGESRKPINSHFFTLFFCLPYENKRISILFDGTEAKKRGDFSRFWVEQTQTFARSSGLLFLSKREKEWFPFVQFSTIRFVQKKSQQFTHDVMNIKKTESLLPFAFPPLSPLPKITCTVFFYCWRINVHLGRNQVNNGLRVNLSGFSAKKREETKGGQMKNDFFLNCLSIPLNDCGAQRRKREGEGLKFTNGRESQSGSAFAQSERL